MIFLGRMLLGVAVPIWFGKPTVILGASVGPIHGSVARWLVARTIGACQYIVVREALSAQFLHSLGISGNVLVAPDMAFLTAPSQVDAIDPMLSDRPCLAVTVINWSFPGHPNPRHALSAYIQTVFETLVACHRKYGLTPVLMEQVTAQHHGHHDRPIVDELFTRLQAAGVPVQKISADLSPAELSFLYGRCQAVLATRLHSVILAACAGTPSVAIRYQGLKTQGIMNGLGMQKYVHDIGSLSSQALLHSIGEVLTQKDSLGAAIRARVAAYQQDIAEAAVAIAALGSSSAQARTPAALDGSAGG